jgi:hypothetical protein
VANGVFTKITDTGAHGYSRSVTTVDYSFNEKGQLMGATGSTTGDQNSEVWTDTNRNEIVDGGEMVDQPTTFAVENTYRVIVGQAQVVKSVTTSYAATVANGVFTKITDTGAHGYSRSVTTVNYSFNDKGQLVGAVGSTLGDQNSEVWTDANRNEIVDAGEMVDQPTTFSVENTYRVIVGQAQVVKSVTTSYAATVAKGVFTKITDTGAHGYSRSVTTVNYSFNEKGQLVKAGGSTVGDQNSEVWTDTNRNEIVDAGEMVDQPTTFSVENTYRVIVGQAQVVKSVTTSYAATVSNGVFTKITDTGAHGYSRSVTTVDYSFNEKGQLMGATGSTTGDQNSEVWTDANRNGVVDAGEMVDQATTFNVENTYRVIVGQAQVVKSVTTSYAATVSNGVFTKITDTGAHGYSRSVTTVNYSFNEKGQLLGAVGSTVGEQNNEVWTDTDRDNVVDPGEMVDQPTTFSVENTYRVIVGQAQVVKSVTTSYSATVMNGVLTKITDTGAHGYSRSVTTVDYSFNEKGQLMGATGSTTGDQNSEVWTDTNRNEIVDAGEMVDQPTTFSVENTYRVIVGQAQVVKSVTTSYAATVANGVFAKITDTGAHGYSRNVTTVNYSFNEKGQLLGAVGSTVGEQNSEVWTDTNRNDVVDAGEMVDQPTTFSVENTYRVIVGQAQVVKSVTTSYAATVSNGVFTKITDTGAHGYSRSVTTVNYSFNEKGQLVGAVGSTVGEQNSEVWTDTDRDNVVDPGEMVDQPTTFTMGNTYAVIVGQAQVVKSVTTSYAATVASGVFTKITDTGAHGYSRSVTTVNYSFNDKGQLVKAVGSTTGDQNSEVWTDLNRNEVVDAGEMVDQPTTFNVENTYRVIVGQAQVVKSVTTSYAATVSNGVFTKITDSGAHGYSRSVTTVDYSFNEKGQLVKAVGSTTGDQNSEVWTDTDRDNVVDPGEMVDQPTTFSVENTYRVIVGQAQVLKSVTTSYAATVANGVFAKITDTGAHGYSRSVTTVNYSFNEKGQLVGAVGSTTGDQNSEVWTDADRDTMVDVGEMVDQPTMFSVVNSYAVIVGQAQVVKSVTTSYAATVVNGVFTKITDTGAHGYSRSVTTVNYSFNEKGQLVGATGTTVGDQNSEVWTDTNRNDVVDPGRWWTSRRRSAWRTPIGVIVGQAQVVKSVTTSYAATVSNGVFTKITDTGAHGYSRSVTTVDYSFNEKGQLMGAIGSTTGDQNSEVWTDTNRNDVVDAGEMVDQPTTFSVENTYRVIVGQAQVVKSVTTSYAATVSNGVFTKNTDTGAHGYSRSVTTVDYSFNEKGQLMGAIGSTTGDQNSEVWTDTNRNGVVDAGEMVDQPTTFSVENIYRVIVGQAQVVKSVTTSYAATVSNGVFTKITDTGAHGYSRSVTIVNYSFNDKGQLVKAVGSTTGDQNSEVWTDTNRNEIVDAGEMVDQPTTFSVENTYQSDRGSGAGGEERDDELFGDRFERGVHEEHGHGGPRV